MMERRQLVVVIPAYNEAAILCAITHAAFAEVPRVIVIDDGSTDGTARAVAGLPVTLLRNPHNLGKAANLWRGIDTALAEGAQGIVTLDGDGQHEPRDLPRLIDAFEAHRDALIVGSCLHAQERIPRNQYYANRFANF
jgi:glycosyltransferase involved in cell wall biosynthesis